MAVSMSARGVTAVINVVRSDESEAHLAAVLVNTTDDEFGVTLEVTYQDYLEEPFVWKVLVAPESAEVWQLPEPLDLTQAQDVRCRMRVESRDDVKTEYVSLADLDL